MLRTMSLFALLLTATACGHVSGQLRAGYGKVDGRDELTLGVDSAQIADHPVSAQVTYGTGDDTKVYGLAAHAGFPASAVAWDMDLRATVKEGGFFFGDTSVVLDGFAGLTHPKGVERVAFQGLRYEVGDLSPSAGELALQAQGHSAVASFSRRFWHVGGVELGLDALPPLRLPVPQ